MLICNSCSGDQPVFGAASRDQTKGFYYISMVMFGTLVWGIELVTAIVYRLNDTGWILSCPVNHNQIRTYLGQLHSTGQQSWQDLLEVGDDLGDVSLHLVQLGVLGSHLPVLAASHRVHNVLKEERNMIGK